MVWIKLSRERYLNPKSDKNNVTYKFIFDRNVYNAHQSLIKFKNEKSVTAWDDYLNQDILEGRTILFQWVERATENMQRVAIIIATSGQNGGLHSRAKKI